MHDLGTGTYTVMQQVAADALGQALLEQPETHPTTARFLNRNYSGYLAPTNGDIPEPDVVFVGEFDEEASPLARQGSRRADRRDWQADTRPADHRGKAVVKPRPAAATTEPMRPQSLRH